MSLPRINFLHLTVSEIQAGQTSSCRPPIWTPKVKIIPWRVKTSLKLYNSFPNFPHLTGKVDCTFVYFSIYQIINLYRIYKWRAEIGDLKNCPTCHRLNLRQNDLLKFIFYFIYIICDISTREELLEHNQNIINKMKNSIFTKENFK